MKESNNAPWYYLFLLIVAGESIFILPFVLARVFRPTVLEVFQLDNTQLGYCFSTYGVVALFSYVLGGPLADKWAPRKLMALALWMTALGGLLYATFPSYEVQKVLYGYWGFTTIFLFWAPMIKATRVWGGANSQGKAFGFLDGGRGLVGALFGSLSVLVFSIFLVLEIGDASFEATKDAYKYVIWTCTAIVFFVGLLVWFFMKMPNSLEHEIILDKLSLAKIKQVFKQPSVGLLMIIILCAYVGYKITDDFSLYAQDVMLYDQVKSAEVGTLLLFLRPVVGVIIGVLADKTQTTFWLTVSFAISFSGALILATGIIAASETILFFVAIFTVATGVYAARSLYFAVMEAGDIPIALTGTAVGLVSVVGYTPDIFIGPVMGYFLDANPGPKGHQNVFWMLAAFSVLGGLASLAYYRFYRTRN